MNRLTIAKIKKLEKPGLYGDGGTLYLAVARGGSKSWIQRVVIGGKRREIGLGGYPVVPLAKARKRAFENRQKIDDDRDPLEEKRKAKRKAATPTFREAALAYFEANKAGWKNAKVVASWVQQMDKHVFPKIGDLTVDRIGREDVLRVLIPIWTEKPETGRKVRQRIKVTLAWAEAHGFVERNVAGEAIDGALPTMRRARKNFRALPHAEVAAALDTIEGSGSSLSAKLAFRFLVLTAARSGEVRGATWDEIDLDARLWTIPKTRMKAGAEHRVPLSDAAMAVLERARELPDETGLVFPSATKRAAMSDMTLMKALRDNGLAERATVHGFRSSFRDWAADTGKPRELAEAALAHTVGGVEGAYFRSDLFDRRRDLMAAWAAYLTGEGAKVVRLRTVREQR